MWNGSPVAVKIVEFTSKEWAAGRLLEGLLSENLSHPNVVSARHDGFVTRLIMSGLAHC
jgi:hypothetical protein